MSLGVHRLSTGYVDRQQLAQRYAIRLDVRFKLNPPLCVMHASFAATVARRLAVRCRRCRLVEMMKSAMVPARKTAKPASIAVYAGSPRRRLLIGTTLAAVGVSRKRAHCSIMARRFSNKSPRR
jgi:hypothetical protein